MKILDRDRRGWEIDFGPLKLEEMVLFTSSGFQCQRKLVKFFL